MDIEKKHADSSPPFPVVCECGVGHGAIPSPDGAFELAAGNESLLKIDKEEHFVVLQSSAVASRGEK